MEIKKGLEKKKQKENKKNEKCDKIKYELITNTKMLKCVLYNDPNDFLSEKDAFFIDGKAYCKILNLSKKFSGSYFYHTLISKIGKPYYTSLKYTLIKNSFSELSPKISLYFPI